MTTYICHDYAEFVGDLMRGGEIESVSILRYTVTRLTNQLVTVFCVTYADGEMVHVEVRG